MEARRLTLLTWLACANFPRTSSRRLPVRFSCEEGHEVITYQGTEVDLSNWRWCPLAEIASRSP